MRKRIIGMLIALSALITLIVPSAAVHAELGIKNELQVSLLSALNIVPGYPSSYDAEAAVTAKDFVRYAYRLIGADISDVSSTLQTYGIDEESKTINASPAIRIILDIVGYNKIIASHGNDYFAFASQIGMTKNANVYSGSNDAVTYDQMVMLFWNTLNMDAVEMSRPDLYEYSDKTIMEQYLKIYEGKGIVNANDTVVIDGGKTSGTGEVRIGDESYLVGNTITEHLIGSNVKFYYLKMMRKL